MKNDLPCVYCITYKGIDTVYVGSTVSPSHRLNFHRSELRHGKHHSSKLQAAWDAYGEDAFEFRIIETVADVDKLADREDYWVCELGALELGGFNSNPVVRTKYKKVRTNRYQDYSCELQFQVELEEYDLFNEAARVNNISLPDWVRIVLRRAAEERLAAAGRKPAWLIERKQ